VEGSELVVSHNRVTGVRLADGQRIAAETVVCCAGWRSPELLAPLGIDLALTASTPGSGTRGLTVTIGGIAPRPDRIIHAPDLDVRPKGEGQLILEAGDIDRRVDMAGEDDGLDEGAQELLTRARMLIPATAPATIVEASLCVRPLPLDGHPLVGPVSGLQGLYIAVTHSGITLAPSLARHAALELLGAESPILRHYRPDRARTGIPPQQG
jgi:glycine/D-amino acid oxidase-like deaminating enzyme